MAPSSCIADRVIHVVGAAQGIGRWFVERVFARSGLLVDGFAWRCAAYDRDDKVHALQGASTYALDVTSVDFAAKVGAHDIVVLALPLDALAAAAANLSRHLQPGVLVVSFTSVQVESHAILSQNLHGVCQILGCHPLFGPGLEHPAGAFTALVEYRVDQASHRLFRHLLQQAGLGVVHLGAHEHDEAMALVQSLTHFTLLAFAATLAALRQRPAAEPERLACLRTPNFRFLHAFSSRLLTIAPSTTGSIQLGASAQEVRRVFLTQANQLDQQLQAATQATQAGAVFAATRRALRGPALADGADFASQAVTRLLATDIVLFDGVQNGQPVLLRHRITGHFQLVRVVAIEPQELWIWGRVGRLQTANGLRIVPWLSAPAIQNYARIGLGDPRRKSPRCGELPRSIERLSRRHLELVDGVQAQAWWRQHVLPARRRVWLPHAARLLLGHLARLIDGVWQAYPQWQVQKSGNVAVDLDFSPELCVDQLQRCLVELCLVDGA